MFAPAPVYSPAMTYGQMQAASANGPALAPVPTIDAAEPLMYVQPAYSAEESDGSPFFYAMGALGLGAAAVVAARRQEKSVAEPDLEAATSAVRVAMLFGGGRSSGKKAAPKKKPAKRGGAKKSAPPADDEDLFYHEGTKGFTGDSFAFVYRQGQA
jgi:MYXO-CTERM domain-containing protein